jgi:hypothetical protein
MLIVKEFTVRLEDRPGMLGKLSKVPAEQNINILAYQPSPHENGNGFVPLVVDNPRIKPGRFRIGNAAITIMPRL